MAGTASLTSLDKSTHPSFTLLLPFLNWLLSFLVPWESLTTIHFLQLVAMQGRGGDIGEQVCDQKWQVEVDIGRAAFG